MADQSQTPEATPRPCKEWATTRSDVSGRFDHEHPCRNSAKYRVAAVDPNKVPPAEEVCGVHVRRYLMDNGDSAPGSRPWIVSALEEKP